MPIFEYEAKTQYATQSGELEAESRNAAILRLRELGLIPVKVKLKDGEKEDDGVTVQPKAAYVWHCPACNTLNYFTPAHEDCAPQRMDPETEKELFEHMGLAHEHEEKIPLEVEIALEDIANSFRLVILPDDVTCTSCFGIFKTKKTKEK